MTITEDNLYKFFKTFLKDYLKELSGTWYEEEEQKNTINFMEIERNNQAPNISNKIFGAPREVIE